MVVDEAMAAGLPVISTTAAGEIRARVIEGETGWLVPANDGSELARAMSSVAKDLPAARRMGEAAAARMASLGPDRWAAEFEKAVSRILALPHPRPGHRHASS
jgi:glycosyltransferase involved in cell wall biosynthesis